MYAYRKDYLNDAMRNLGDMFDYAINEKNYEAQEFYDYFVESGVAGQFESGNPKYIAGKSGAELVYDIMLRINNEPIKIESVYKPDRSPEYWMGWILAYYQWFRNMTFKDMRKRGILTEEVLKRYNTLHEADVTKFVAVADVIVENYKNKSTSHLQEIRKARGVTQKELAENTDVSLRMIQLYEQKQQDINKAEAATLYRLSKYLGCMISDLFE